jgi:hypothetical protein
MLLSSRGVCNVGERHHEEQPDRIPSLGESHPHLGAAGLEIPEDAMRPRDEEFSSIGGGVASDCFSRRRA